MHAREGTAYARPSEEEREHNGERDNFIEMEVERKESRRPGPGDVNDPSGGFGRQATSTRKLGQREEAEERGRGSQKGQ
jgi:hypothetical protein